MSEFPRTLFLIDNLNVSGAEKVAVNLLRHAQAQGLPVEGIVCMDDLIGASASGANIHSFEGPTGGEFFPRVFRGLSRVPRIARFAKGFDLLVPVTVPAIPWAVAAAIVTGAKVVPWIHYDIEGLALDPFRTGRLIRDFLMNTMHMRMAPAFDRLLFVSDAAKQSFVKLIRRDKPGWAAVPNVYDRQALSDAPSPCAAGIERCRSNGKFALLFAGRIFRQKRWEEAVKVAEILARRHFPFELHIAGDGPEMPQLRETVAASPARDHILLYGFDLNVVAALAKADALLLTSLYEAWPTIILEAFDLGVPVFSYDCPSGPAEMLGRNLERGVLCAGGAEEMADRIQWLLTEERKPLREQMTADARRFLDAHLPDQALESWRRVLRAMMA